MAKLFAVTKQLKEDEDYPIGNPSHRPSVCLKVFTYRQLIAQRKRQYLKQTKSKLELSYALLSNEATTTTDYKTDKLLKVSVVGVLCKQCVNRDVAKHNEKLKMKKNLGKKTVLRLAEKFRLEATKKWHISSLKKRINEIKKEEESKIVEEPEEEAEGEDLYL